MATLWRKYSRWARRDGILKRGDGPRLVLLMGAGALVMVRWGMFANDLMYGTPDKTLTPAYWKPVGKFLIVYTFMIIALRFRSDGAFALFDSLWACNICMLWAGIGMITNRPHLVSAAAAAVGVDQVCWFVDVLFWALKGTFPVGVAKYMPEVSGIRRLTSWHHLWFIPLLLIMLRTRGTEFPAGLGLSSLITICLPLAGRFFTPHTAITPTGIAHYTNVNQGYGVWKDVKIKPFHIADSSHPALYFPFVWALGNVLNAPAYGLIRVLFCIALGGRWSL